MAFRKYAALAIALALVAVSFGCTEDITATSTVDNQPVLSPSNVIAVALADGTVRVSWEQSSQPDINGYNLYRDANGHGSPQRLNSTRIKTNTFIDGSAEAWNEYEYRVTAVNSQGKESRPSTVVVEVQGRTSGDGDGRDFDLN